ncbi:GspH/FimT family pseudopilin [Litorilituus sediminis]|uniref:Type II secretion system protein H n=1 Tax=Litorilituus sediminis TaxID=718192 RepID=A0A4P6P5D6_9GAMM|nr:GspH/FimT family pseudopilin [Litorilituus sediminis]QBG35339.1 prepilin-type N-terminal cleavage/methylation domain-containing protein [Litorilituus sediminis]
MNMTTKQGKLLPQTKSSIGMTLIELLVSVAIISVLSFIAIPNLQPFIVKLRVDNEISNLHRALLKARNHAINSGNIVTLCPLNANNECTTLWQNELSVFADLNNNLILDEADGERILISKAAIKTSDKLVYGRYRTRVSYHPDGHLSGLSNGTFRYCPKGFEQFSRAIVIARSGRLYTSSDIDNDGIEETRSNNEITCN